jgi:hypothetical protein
MGQLDIQEGDVLPQRAPAEIFYRPKPEEKPAPISAAEGRLSPAYGFDGPSPLVLFRQKPGTDGKSVEVPVANYPVPSGVSRALLLLLPEGGQGAAYRVMAIPNAPANIPPGNALVKNLTADRVAVLLGDHRIFLDPDASALVEISGVQNHSLPFRLAVAIEGQDWKLRHSETKIVNPTDSLIFLVHHRTGSDKLYRVLTLKNPLPAE